MTEEGRTRDKGILPATLERSRGPLRFSGLLFPMAKARYIKFISYSRAKIRTDVLYYFSLTLF